MGGGGGVMTIVCTLYNALPLTIADVPEFDSTVFMTGGKRQGQHTYFIFPIETRERRSLHLPCEQYVSIVVRFSLELAAINWPSLYNGDTIDSMIDF